MHRLISPPFRPSIWFLSVCLAGVLWRPTPIRAAAANIALGPRTGQWAHEVSGLKPDPNVIWGRLDNGLRYALLPHHGVPGRVSLRLMVLTGSLDETDEEQGIAHFIEHLVFRDSRHFTTEQQVRFFQHLGMDMSSDVNARTGHSETVYMIELRESTPALLSQALLWTRDVADGAAFTPEEIDEERGVILSELRVRGGVFAENSDASGPVFYKGLRFPERSPGGKPERIRAFQRANFVEFYHRNYRSDQMIVVAAGDFEAPGFVAQIKENFADMVKPAGPLPPRDEGRLDATKGLRAGVFKISGVGSAQGAAACTTAIAPRPDSREAHVEDMRRNFASNVFAMRVAKETGGSSSYRREPGFEFTVASTGIDPDDWARGFGVLDDLVRFTLLKGFDPREIEMVKRRMATRIQFQLEQKDSVDPAGLVEALVDSITSHSVYLGFEQEMRWHQEWLGTMTAKELHTAFQSMWDPERMAFFVGGDIDIEGGGAEIVKKIMEGRKGGLRNYRPDTRKEFVFKLPTWGTPTNVVESSDVPELGARLMRFGNNVRLNFIRNRSDPGVVLVLARFGTGVLEMPEDRPALKDIALQTLVASGTTHFTTEQFGQIVQDHIFDIDLTLDENDAFAFQAAVSPDKIEIPLALFADTLHRPIFATINHREEKIKAVLSRILNESGLEEGEAQLQDYLFRGDPRFTRVDEAKDYLRVSAVDVRNWLEEPLTRGYLEVSIVGDITEEAAVQAVSRTLGSLPTRDATKTLAITPRPIKLTATPGFERIEFVGEQHIGQAVGIWPVQQTLTARDQAALFVLAKVLEQHVFREVRNRLGLAYSPTAGLQRYSGFSNFALLRANVSCDPAESSRVANLLEDIGTHLAEGGTTPDEFTGARGTLSSQLRFAMHEPDVQLSLIRRAQENPEWLKGSIEIRQGLVDQITYDEVNAWAKKILSRKNCRTAAIVPKQYIGIFQSGQ